MDEKKIIDIIEGIDIIFLEILRDHTAGNPMNEDIKWTDLDKSQISELFKKRGYNISEYTVEQLFKKHNFKKRQAFKTETFKDVEGRDEQFLKIAALKEEFINSENDPIISIDVKKKEQIGNFYRDGKMYTTERINVFDHDFASYGDGSIIPHGIYDLKRNETYMTIGTSKDTSEFWCDCFREWWEKHGKINYPHAKCILVLVDGGGSNSSRSYVFKEDLQKLANDIGVKIRIAHYPPYTSKYNPIEHRVFCHVTRACEGAVFSSVELVKELINKTTTQTGLKVFASIKNKIYQTGRKVSDLFKEKMEIIFDSSLSKWNYVVVPQML